MTEPTNPGPQKASDAWKSLAPLKVVAVSWRDLGPLTAGLAVLTVIGLFLTLRYAAPAPPHSLTLASGPKGSTFATLAERYEKLLARNGIKLNVLYTEGSVDNLDRMSDPHSGVDIALIQAGLKSEKDLSHLDSLGTMFYEPLSVFYRSPKPLQRLSELRGQRIAIGPEGSGVRALALALLKANEIEPKGGTELSELEGQPATGALLERKLDAVFLTGDSAAPKVVREMLHAEGIRLFDFVQADAYVRRFPYLSKLNIPAGAFDLGEQLPPTSINMLAPTVELVAHNRLHPALSDLLIEAAFEIHGHASLLQASGQFPTPVTNAFPLSSEASRYYKSGNKSFMYRYLPFWLASLLDRALVVLLPIVVIVIPGLRLLPQLYGWRIKRRIHRRYSELMALERESLGQLTDERRQELLQRLAAIERQVISGRIPGSYAESLYVLREHIGMVRSRLVAATGAPAS